MAEENPNVRPDDKAVNKEDEGTIGKWVGQKIGDYSDDGKIEV